jgi:hypothetical protein
MHQPARVLFNMNAGDADPEWDPFGNELEMSIDGKRQVELGYLVSLWEIGIEVILAIEFAKRWNFTVERDSRQDRGLDCPLVQRRQSAREPAADDADEGVRRCVGVPGRAATVHLGFGEQLRVDFESDDSLVSDTGVATLHLIHHCETCPSRPSPSNGREVYHSPGSAFWDEIRDFVRLAW